MMSKFKVKGTIKEIGEKKVLDNGAVVLNYVIEETNENGRTSEYSFGMYNKEEQAEFTDKFIEYNKVGNNVEVEFTIRTRQHEGRRYTSLNHWRVENLSGAPTEQASAEDDLPF